jgi:hypothetical protein
MRVRSGRMKSIKLDGDTVIPRDIVEHKGPGRAAPR